MDEKTQKLNGYGIKGNLLQFFKNFLTNRTQKVKIGNVLSAECLVTSGVPQGTVLGPLLFSLYINDVQNEITNSKILLFADDCKIYRGIDNANDQIALQNDLCHFVDWCKKWQLRLAVNKCCFHSVGFRNNLESSYTLDGEYLDYEQFVRDLGIIIDDMLKFSFNTQHIIKKSFLPVYSN